MNKSSGSVNSDNWFAILNILLIKINETNKVHEMVSAYVNIVLILFNCRDGSSVCPLFFVRIRTKTPEE